MSLWVTGWGASSGPGGLLGPGHRAPGHPEEAEEVLGGRGEANIISYTNHQSMKKSSNSQVGTQNHAQNCPFTKSSVSKKGILSTPGGYLTYDLFFGFIAVIWSECIIMLYGCTVNTLSPDYLNSPALTSTITDFTGGVTVWTSYLHCFKHWHSGLLCMQDTTQIEYKPMSSACLDKWIKHVLLHLNRSVDTHT